MAHARWYPFDEFAPLREVMHQVIEERMGLPIRTPLFGAPRAFPIDLFETPELFRLDATVAGIAPEHIQVSTTADTVTIHATGTPTQPEDAKGSYLVQERTFGELVRMITLPQPIEPEQVTSTYEHGVLTVLLPKAVSALPKQIPIKTKGSEKAFAFTR
jgi:HSP20 family protein